jgi:chromosome segregation ATPase
MERHVRDRIANLEHRKNASTMDSRTQASAREENSHHSKELEVYLKNAAYQLNELKSEIARVESLLETRNNLQEQTRDSNDETRNSLERILNLLGEMGVKQDRILAAQDQTYSRISRIEEMVGNMDTLSNNILKLLASQGQALKATGPGPSIDGSPSERKGSGRRSSTTVRKRKMVLNKVLPNNELAGGTRRRSSRLASKWGIRTSAQSMMF